MSVLPGEGTHVILYGSASFAARTRTHAGYVARPDVAGAHPVIVILGEVSGGVKELCRQLARHGLAAIAIRAGTQPGDVDDVMRWIRAPGTPWADPERAAVAITDGAAVAGLSSARAIVLLDAAPDLELPGKPLLGVYGGEGEAATAARNQHGTEPLSQLVIYPDAAAGFWDIGADGFHEEAAADAVARIVSFLGDALEEAA